MYSDYKFGSVMGTLKLKTFSKYQKYTKIFIYNAKFVIGLQETEFKFHCAKYSKQIDTLKFKLSFLKIYDKF